MYVIPARLGQSVIAPFYDENGELLSANGYMQVAPKDHVTIVRENGSTITSAAEATV